MDGVDGEEELAGPSRLPPLMKWVAGGAVLAALAIIGAQLSGGAGLGADRALDRSAIPPRRQLVREHRQS